MRKIKYKVDFSNREIIVKSAMQNDNISLEIEVLDNGEQVSLADSNIELLWVKPDNFPKKISENITLQNNKIIVNDVDVECTSVSGICNFELTIKKSDKQISTFPLTLKVIQSVINNPCVENTVMKLLEELIVASNNGENVLVAMDKWAEEHQDLENIADVLSSVKASVKELSSQIDEIAKNGIENKLKNKKILAIGDSYIKGHTLSDNQTWLYKLANRNNMTKYNYGVNGICLAKATTQTNGCIMDNINNIISSVTSTDYIVVLAGHNDSNASLNGGAAIPIGSNTDEVNTTFKGALNNLITLLLNAYPKAKILFLTPFNRRNTEEPYCNAMKEICANYGIPCFDNFHAGGVCWQNTSQKNVYDLNNSIHFNEEGQERLSYLYESILKNELALNSSVVEIDTSNFVIKTEVPYNFKLISKTDYNNLTSKNSNTVYFVQGYGVYIGINCIISTDNQQGTGEESSEIESSPLNTFVLGTLSPDDTASLINNNTNRATSLKNELVSGDVIGFTSDLTSTYKFAVDKAFDSKLEWIGGGYQTSYRYTITEDGTYNIMIARQDNEEITSSELSELNNIFKKFSI